MANEEVTPASEATSAVPAPRRRLRLVEFAVIVALLISAVAYYVLHGSRGVDVVDGYRTMLSASNTASAGIVKGAWADPAKPDDIKPHGDIVWSVPQHRGYARFSNLSANDPTKEQYQFWIFDDSLEESVPVSGGVFDLTTSERDDATGDTIVTFSVNQPTKKPVKFGITREKPGGVQRSERGRLLLLAKVN